MSLWLKAPGSITFADVDRFLQTKQPEGIRLDYKVDRPSDLAKYIAAFANTLGGLIILGVDSDKTTNQPIWPPLKGMPSTPSIEEAVTSIARDAIYPPVRIETSPVIPNDLWPGHSILIVRVDESRDAPHAVDAGRKVYERSGSTTKPHNFAHIDRIKYLFDRRQSVEVEREAIVSRTVSKYAEFIDSSLNPTCWVATIPVFPWRPICKASKCHEFLSAIVANEFSGNYGTGCQVQRIPDGALLYVHDTFAMRPNQRVLKTQVFVVQANGFFFSKGTILALDRSFPPVRTLEIEHQSKILEMPMFWNRIESMFAFARVFYGNQVDERPGLLQAAFGLDWIRNYRLLQQGKTGSEYPDDNYRDSLILPCTEFVEAMKPLAPLRDRLVFGFDLETPVGL